jgi:hypothetical protein
MIFYITVAAAAVLMAGIIGTKQPVAAYHHKASQAATRRQMLDKAALVFVFALLFGVSSLRFNVGNDYNAYVQIMHVLQFNPAYVSTEIGFNSVVWLIYGLCGYENYLMVFAVFAFATIALFMRAIYRDSENFLFSFFLFMAFGYYYQSFSSVRYYLAVALALWAIPLVLQKKWLPFVLVVLLGATFHKSLLVVLPLYFLASLAWKKWMLIAFACFCATVFFFQDLYLRLLVFLYPSYRDTEFLAGGTSVVNIVRCGAILAFSLVYYRQAIKDHLRNQFYFYCNAGAFVLYTCCSFIPEVSRIAYYLTATHIFFLPAIIGRIENKKQRWFFVAAVVVAALLYFAMYLYKAPNDGVRVLPYQIFLFHERIEVRGIDI